MIDMLQNAKQLIAKGKVLNDPELIQMGMELLEQYDVSYDTLTQKISKQLDLAHESGVGYGEPCRPPQYVCENCGYVMPMDKEGRKRCPECKKHKLKLVEPALVQPQPSKKIDPQVLLDALATQEVSTAPQQGIEQFHMQIRSQGIDRIHYDESGNPNGIIRRREAVDPSKICNVWKDNGEECNDPGNEQLKQFTKISPRTRQPVKYVTVECELCHKSESVHPIHAGGRGRHICEKCIRKRSGR